MSYQWLQADVPDVFEEDGKGRDNFLGTGYFQKVSVYRNRFVGNMQHFVCTRRFCRERDDGAAVDPI